MPELKFVPFHPGLDPSDTVMVDGYAPGFRMISHWPGHGTPDALRHDVTTGSALAFSEMSESHRSDLVGNFSTVTNNHYDTDGALSLFAMLQPSVALEHRELMVAAARAGDLAIWGGEEALALELQIMSDLAPFLPFTTPPFDQERLSNLSALYLRTFERMESFLKDPLSLDDDSAQRFSQVVEDVERVKAKLGVSTTEFIDDDLAVVETDGPITTFGLRLAAGELFRVLLVHPDVEGNRYRFCFRGESWWDLVSVNPKPRTSLELLASRFNELEERDTGMWWAAPPDWTVPELGFGQPVTFRHQAVRFDPITSQDPASSLSVDVVVEELRRFLRDNPPFEPLAASARPTDETQSPV